MRYSKAFFGMNKDSDYSSESSEEEGEMIDEVASSEMNEGNAGSSETSEEEAKLCQEWRNLTIDDEIEDEEYKWVWKRISLHVKINELFKDEIRQIEKGLAVIQKHIEKRKLTESMIWIDLTLSDWYKDALNLRKELEAMEESLTQMVEVKSVKFIEADKTERISRILEQAYKRFYFESAIYFYFEKFEEEKLMKYLERILDLQLLMDI